MKKFFSLLSDKKITLAPGKKVVPKKEFETLKKSSSILKEVKKEVINYKKSVAKEAEILKEEAYKKVYKLESLPSLQKLVVDVPAELFTHYKVYRGSKVLGGREFTGGIISIFYKGKLIYQKTNNRNLRKLGIKEL